MSITSAVQIIDPSTGYISNVLIRLDGKDVTFESKVYKPEPEPELYHRVEEQHRCKETTVFWPDDEACDAECIREEGHEGEHYDEILGEWED